MHIWDIGTVSHCTWMVLQCDTFFGETKKLFFRGPAGPSKSEFLRFPI